MSTKREANKAIKSDRILGAARQLIHETGSTNFSMQELSTRAEVALVTPYNYFGSKAGVLKSLLHREHERAVNADQEEIEAGHPPLERLLHYSLRGATTFIEGGQLYKLLTRATFQKETVNEQDFRSVDEWIDTYADILKDAAVAGDLHPFIDLRLAAQSINNYWLGVSVKWALNEYDDDMFLAYTRYGIVSALLAIAADQSRPKLQQWLSEAQTLCIQAGAK